MRKKTGLILLLFLLTGLTACAKVPENKQVKKTGKVTSQSDNIQMDTLSKVLEQAKKYKEITCDNLYFEQEFEVNKPEEIGLLAFKQKEHFHKDGMEILRKFIGKINPEAIEDKNFTIPGLQYIDKKDGKSFSIENNGFLFFGTEEADKWLSIPDESGEYTRIDQISLDSAYEEETYQWKGTTLKLSEMTKEAQKYADDFTKEYDSMDWKPSSVNIYTNKEGEYFFEYLFTKSYKGVHLFYGDYRYSMDYVKELYVSVMQPFLVLNASKEMIIIDNYAGIMDYVETKKTYDKILTLESAAKCLSDKLSSYKAYNVYHANLEYRLVRTKGGEVDDPEFYYCDWAAGNEYEARPCWTFYLSNDLSKELNQRTFAMVDCITGEVEFVSGR